MTVPDRPRPDAVVFDAYGTLFDVHAVVAALDRIAPGRGVVLSATWREKQIEYALLRTLSGRYVPFSEVTRDALRWAAECHGVALGSDDEARLLDAYRALAPHAHARETLDALRSRGLRTAILSNGDAAMLDPVVRHAGLHDVLDAVLSVDAVRRFKTAPETYALATARFDVAADRVLFVSSNGWDVFGATAFGFTTLWIDRAGRPTERLGVAPHRIGRSLADVVPFVDALATSRHVA